jgi:hypothetical protein
MRKTGILTKRYRGKFIDLVWANNKNSCILNQFRFILDKIEKL